MNVPERPYIGSVYWTDDFDQFFVYDGERWLKVQNSCPHCGQEMPKTGRDMV